MLTSKRTETWITLWLRTRRREDIQEIHNEIVVHFQGRARMCSATSWILRLLEWYHAMDLANRLLATE